MRKVIAIVLALSLGACAAVRNPIQKAQLAEIESGYGVLLASAKAYRDLCAQGIVKGSCKAVVAALQQADKKVEVALDAADDFVRKNPTLDATSFITGAQSALATFQSIAIQNGVK